MKSICDCLIEQLFMRSFASLTYTEKESFIKSSKPEPTLNITSKVKTGIRKFNKQIYSKHNWICGCAKISKLFCWPCLLFSTDKNVWNRDGYSDLNNLNNSCIRHELSQSHLLSSVQFRLFGRENRIESSLSSHYSEQKKLFNEEVSKNRYIVKKLIDVVCFLAKQELAFRGGRENVNSENRGNSVELLYLVSESDQKLKDHLRNATVFTGISNHIQNDLIQAIGYTLLHEIKKEISQTSFVAVIVDESTDNTKKAQLSTVLRYVREDGEIQERFIGFIDVSENRTANFLFEHILQTLTQYNCINKLIAQTYDGAAVMSGEHNGVQKKIKDICPNALFVH